MHQFLVAFSLFKRSLVIVLLLVSDFVFPGKSNIGDQSLDLGGFLSGFPGCAGEFPSDDVFLDE